MSLLLYLYLASKLVLSHSILLIFLLILALDSIEMSQCFIHYLNIGIIFIYNLFDVDYFLSLEYKCSYKSITLSGIIA